MPRVTQQNWDSDPNHHTGTGIHPVAQTQNSVVILDASLSFSSPCLLHWFQLFQPQKHMFTPYSPAHAASVEATGISHAGHCGGLPSDLHASIPASGTHPVHSLHRKAIFFKSLATCPLTQPSLRSWERITPSENGMRQFSQFSQG